MRIVWAIIPLILIGTLGIQNVDGGVCSRSIDWPEKPCFSVNPPSQTKFIEGWSPYYEYKGSEVMERKKIEMFQSLENKTFDTWVNSLENYRENYNIYSYYVSTGEIAKQSKYSGFRIEEHMSPKKQQSIYTKPYDLKCRNDLQPILLQSGTYACVKDESRKKLLELDLINEDYSRISVYQYRDYDVGYPVSITMRNEGMVPVQSQSPFIHIFNSTGQILGILDGTMQSLRGELLKPGDSFTYQIWSNSTFNENTPPGQYAIEIHYQSDIHKKKKSIDFEFDIIDPVLANFTINYPDDWNIKRLISSGLTSFYSRSWLETNPELYGLDVNVRPWVISDKQNYHTGYTAISENFDLLGITIQNISLTASKYFEIWNDVCNFKEVDYECNIMQSNKIETTINDKPVIIYSYVENREKRGYLAQEIISDQEIVSIYEQNFMILIELIDEQETWLIRGHYAISPELLESTEIITDNIFSSIVNSFEIYDYEYEWIPTNTVIGK